MAGEHSQPVALANVTDPDARQQPMDALAAACYGS